MAAPLIFLNVSEQEQVKFPSISLSFFLNHNIIFHIFIPNNHFLQFISLINFWISSKKFFIDFFFFPKVL